MNLYELSDSYQQILDLLQSVDTTAEPEYAQALRDTLDSVNASFDDKAEGYVSIINQLKYDIDVVSNEIKRLSEKKSALENNRKKLSEVLTDEMEGTGKTKIKTPRFSIWVQNNPESLQVKDESHIPSEYFIEQAPKLDKRELLKYLKLNRDESLEGVEIVQTRGVRYR